MGFRYSMTIKFKNGKTGDRAISVFSEKELKSWGDFHPHIKRILNMYDLQLGDYEVWHLESKVEN